MLTLLCFREPISVAVNKNSPDWDSELGACSRHTFYIVYNQLQVREKWRFAFVANRGRCVWCVAGVARGRNESVEWQVAEQSAQNIRPLDKKHICLNHSLILSRRVRGSTHKWLWLLGHMINCQDDECLINCLTGGHLFTALRDVFEAIDDKYLQIMLSVSM